MCEILKATTRWREKSFFLRKLILFRNLARPRVYDAIDLKFLGKQINVITKKSRSAICEIMNINAIFRIFLNASHSVFLKKH